MIRFQRKQKGHLGSDVALSAIGILSVVTAALTFMSGQEATRMGGNSKTVWDLDNAIDNGRFLVPDHAFRTAWGYRVMGPFDGWRPLRRGGETDLIKNGYLGLENEGSGYALDMRGNHGESANDGLTQKVNLAAGQRYVLALNVANVTNEEFAGVKIYLDDAQVGDFRPGSNQPQMQRFETKFRVPAQSGTVQDLTLKSYGTRGAQFGVFVDNLQIRQY